MEKQQNPTRAPAAGVDSQLVRSALEKRRLGRTPNKQESAALRRFEKFRDAQQRAEHFAAISKREWRQWSGRQDKVLNEQAVRYGPPIGGAEIDLPAFVRWFHDFLAANHLKLSAPDSDDPMLAGANSPALERYRLARAKREEFGLQRDLGQWLPRDGVHEGLALFAAILRQAGETLQRQFGREAHAILEDAVNDAIGAFSKHFDPNAGARDGDPGGRSAA